MFSRARTNESAIVEAVREEFERKSVDQELLRKLYLQDRLQHEGMDIHEIIRWSIEHFPHGADLFASIYLRHRMKRGVVYQGTFFGHDQTILLLDGNRMADITADRYGGTQIYLGPLMEPWRVKRN